MDSDKSLSLSPDSVSIVASDATDDSTSDVITKGLLAFMNEATGISDHRWLSVAVHDSESKAVLGGATGRSSLGLLFLDLFYLPRHLRGSGLGSKVLKAFEEEGLRRQCRSAVLYTANFMAPEFYEQHGWRRFGEIPCSPPGTSRIFMTKSLE